MRPDLVVYSASALVVGVMCLVFGAALSPAEAGTTVASAVRVAGESGGRWLGIAVLWFCASMFLTCGMPAIVSLFVTRAHRLGLVGVAVLTVGAVGTSGFAMVMVFLQALAKQDAIRPDNVATITSDIGVGIVLWTWVTGFYLGCLLIAAALLVSRATAVWVPAMLLLFVVMMPFEDAFGRVGQVGRLLALALAFTAMAVAAVGRTQRPSIYLA